MSEERKLHESEDYLTDVKFQLCRYIETTFDEEDIFKYLYYPDEICDDLTEHGDCRRDGKSCNRRIYQLREV